MFVIVAHCVPVSEECLNSHCISCFLMIFSNFICAAGTGSKSKGDVCDTRTMACPWVFGKIKGNQVI